MTADNQPPAEKPCCCGGANGGSPCCGTGKWIWIVLVAAIAGVLVAKNVAKKPAPETTPAATGATAGVAAAVPAATESAGPLPRLVDLGATKCVPCKMMAPILEDLKQTYAGKLDVEFIDVWENPDAGPKYGVSVIPLQIFYDASGKELFRHEGFFAKEDILAKWKELGVDLSK